MKIDKSLLSGTTPMLLLSLLQDGEMYGYQMVSELYRRSDDTFQLKEGTLYPLLHSLEKAKYIRSRMELMPNGRERKYYRLTESGEELLTQKTEEWRYFCAKVGAVLGMA